MAAKDPAIRFGIRRDDGLILASWKLWVYKSDVYLAARGAMGRWLKVSLHKTGDWRVAETEELRRKQPDNPPALRWRRPSANAAGWTPALAIVVPATELREPLGTPPVDTSAEVEWFPAPVSGHKRLFMVFFSDARIQVEAVRSDRVGDSIVGWIRLLNGESVWLVSREEPMTDADRDRVKEPLAKLRIHTRPGTRASIRGAHLLDLCPGDERSQPEIIDIALGQEQVVEDG